MGTTNTAAPAAPAQQAAPALPFQIASRNMSRLSFNVATTNLAASTPTPISPIQIPAVGYLARIDLEVTITGSGGTSPANTADGPFNVLSAIELKTAAGNDIIVPLTGYQAYLMNKYGCQWFAAPYSDPKLNRQFANTAPSAHFFLSIPLELDPETGYGSIPALASNRSYQLLLTAAAISTVYTGAPSATLAIAGTAWYWSEPPAATQSGVAQATQPIGLGSLSQWQLEMPPITPGDKYVRSNNVGNVIRCLIFTIRNSSGARIDTNGLGPATELYLDNDPMFYLTQTEWEYWMASLYGFTASSKDAAGGLDTGVYVIPFFALADGCARPNGSRAQYLPTLDASLLQIRNTFGSAVSTLEILTNSVIPTDSVSLYQK
jgi:hypothetical protein